MSALSPELAGQTARVPNRAQEAPIAQAVANNIADGDTRKFASARKASFSPGHVEYVTGKVVGVHDGDSLTVLTENNSELIVRLEGIDAPELKQPFGNSSKHALSDLVFGKAVRVKITGTDIYRRTLGNVFVDRNWVNLSLVQGGFAWHFTKYSSDVRLRDAELNARNAHVGLWNDSLPVPPWEWRKASKTASAIKNLKTSKN